MPAARVTDASDATTDRVDAQSSPVSSVPLILKMPTLRRVGFVLFRGTQGRAPSAALLLPPESMRRTLLTQPGAGEGEKSRQRKAEPERAKGTKSFSCRRHRKPRESPKTQGTTESYPQRNLGRR